MTPRAATARFRLASADDAEALRDLERAANLVGLAHVFPAADFPFPDEEVLARWRGTLAEAEADPGLRVEVVDGPASGPGQGPGPGAGGRGGRLSCFVAHDTEVLRHLAVHPDEWGTGLAGAAVARAVAAIRAGGASRALLWCLEENHRARAVYAHLGWAPTGISRRARWPPHPVELEHCLGFADG